MVDKRTSVHDDRWSVHYHIRSGDHVGWLLDADVRPVVYRLVSVMMYVVVVVPMFMVLVTVMSMTVVMTFVSLFYSKSSVTLVTDVGTVVVVVVVTSFMTVVTVVLTWIWVPKIVTFHLFV